MLSFVVEYFYSVVKSLNISSTTDEYRIKAKGTDGYTDVPYVFLRKTYKKKSAACNTEEQLVIFRVAHIWTKSTLYIHVACLCLSC